MADLVGRTIGRHRIIKEIGRGGMAIVYLAVQPELNRRVAIKVLPSQLTFDATLIKRFQQEAVAAAGLKHPNIVTIHDVGEQDGIYYIVMEYVEGQPLSELIKRLGSLPLPRVLKIIEQVASALDYAHREGFVHRDIKPSNIIVGPADHVTLTDFGIVKAAEGTSLTRSGGTIGTPQYMSPEQAKGAPVDYRTDIYSLGIVLYEMLTGRVPFTAENTPAILHKQVYETPPPIRRLKPGLSPPLETVVDKALAKEPRSRFQSAGEMARALAGARRQAPEPPTVRERGRTEPPTVAAPPVRRGVPVWAVAGGGAGVILLIMIIAFSALGKGPATTSGVAVLPTATSTATRTLSPTPTAIPPRVSAPTTRAPTAPSTPRSPTATPLPRATPTPKAPAPTTTAVPPTIAPTPTPTPLPPTPTLAGPGGWIALASDRDGDLEIYTMSVDGSNLRKLTDNSANDEGPSWSPDGRRIVFHSFRDGYQQVYVMYSDGNGQTRLLMSEYRDQWPIWSPDGREVAFARGADHNGDRWYRTEVFVMNSDETNVRRLTFSSGHTGEYAHMAWPSGWSPDSSRILFYWYLDGYDQLYIMNRDGTGQRKLTTDAYWNAIPTMSPNGSRIAFASFRDGDYEIYVMNADGTNQTRLTFSPGEDWRPRWSEDGSRIIFESRRDGRLQIYSMNPDGTDQVRLSDNTANDHQPDSRPESFAPSSP